MSYSLEIVETATGTSVSIIQGKCVKCKQRVALKDAVKHKCEAKK